MKASRDIFHKSSEHQFWNDTNFSVWRHETLQKKQLFNYNSLNESNLFLDAELKKKIRMQSIYEKMSLEVRTVSNTFEKMNPETYQRSTKKLPMHSNFAVK